MKNRNILSAPNIGGVSGGSSLLKPSNTNKQSNPFTLATSVKIHTFLMAIFERFLDDEVLT